MEVKIEEIKKYYDDHKEIFKDLYNTVHILVKTEEEAKNIINKLEAGEDFEELAKRHSFCPSNEKGGELGFFPKGLFVKEYEEEAYKLKNIGEITQPVKTQFGYHIIKLVDKKEGYASLDEMKDVIKMIIEHQKNNNNY